MQCTLYTHMKNTIHAFIHENEDEKKIRSPQRYMYVGDDDERQRKKNLMLRRRHAWV
jgi:hypothetical protein